MRDGPISVRADWRALGAILMVLLLVYSSAILVDYGFADDYSFLVRSKAGSGVLFDLVAAGRPLNGFLMQTAFRLTPGVDGLDLMRLVGVLGTAALGWGLYLLLRSAGEGRISSFFLALGSVLLPSFQVYVAWAQYFAAPWACLAAVGSAHLTWVAARPRACLPRMALAVLAALLLLIALTIYQPAAMMFWVAVGVRWITGCASWRHLGRYALIASVTALGALLAEFALFRWLTTAVVPADVRVDLGVNLLAKLEWFVREPLIGGLNLLRLIPSSALAVGVAAFICVGLWLRLRGSWGERLLRWTGALALVPLTYLPNLLVVDSWASFRTRPALSVLLLVYAYYAFWTIMRQLEAWRQADLTAWGYGGMATFVGLGVVLAAAHVTQLFAVPQSMEYRYLKSRLSPPALDSARAVWIIRPNWSQGVSRYVTYDEFGKPSSFPEYASAPMARLALGEVDPSRADVTVRSFAYDDPLPAMPEGVVLVDLRALVSLR